MANLPVHVVRYEDLRDRAVPTLQSILRFTLPVSMQPSLERLRCATVDDPRNDPYWSRKSPSFSAYHKYDAEAREWILKAVKDEWLVERFAKSMHSDKDCPGANTITMVSSPIQQNFLLPLTART